MAISGAACKCELLASCPAPSDARVLAYAEVLTYFNLGRWWLFLNYPQHAKFLTKQGEKLLLKTLQLKLQSQSLNCAKFLAVRAAAVLVTVILCNWKEKSEEVTKQFKG